MVGDLKIQITMSDGSVWAVPVAVVARARAQFFVSAFDGDSERSLAEDTLPLFDSNEDEIIDWAVTHMDWIDVAEHAEQISPAPPLTPDDFQECWLHGKMIVVGDRTARECGE